MVDAESQDEADAGDAERQAAEPGGAASALGSVIDHAHEAFVSMDAGGFVTGWNAEAERTFGWAAHEVTGKILADTIIPERFREAHWQGLQRYLSTGEAAVLGTPVWSIFEGKLGAIDELLVHEGRLRLLQDPAEIEPVKKAQHAWSDRVRRDPAELLRLALPWLD